MWAPGLQQATPEPAPSDGAGVGEVHLGIQRFAAVKYERTLPIACRNLRAELQIPYLTFTLRKVHQCENRTIELH
jgi:hypothetical protein